MCVYLCVCVYVCMCVCLLPRSQSQIYDANTLSVVTASGVVGAGLDAGFAAVTITPVKAYWLPAEALAALPPKMKAVSIQGKRMRRKNTKNRPHAACTSTPVCAHAAVRLGCVHSVQLICVWLCAPCLCLSCVYVTDEYS